MRQCATCNNDCCAVDKMSDMTKDVIDSYKKHRVVAYVSDTASTMKRCGIRRNTMTRPLWGAWVTAWICS